MQQFRQVIALFCASVILAVAPFQSLHAIPIDDFGTFQSLSCEGSGCRKSSAVYNAGSIGRYRKLSLGLTSGIAVGASVSPSASQKFYSYSNFSSSTGSSTLIWDGTNTNPDGVSPTAYVILNLIPSGENAVNIKIEKLTLRSGSTATLLLTFHDAAIRFGGPATYSGAIPLIRNYQNENIVVPFSQFSGNSQIPYTTKAITLAIDGTNLENISISCIETVNTQSGGGSCGSVPVPSVTPNQNPIGFNTGAPAVEPTQVVTPRPTPTPSPSPTPSLTPRPTPTPSPSPTPSLTPRPTPTSSPSPTPSLTPRPTPTPSPSPRPSLTPRPTPTPSPSPTPSLTPRPTPTPSPAPSLTSPPSLPPTGTVPKRLTSLIVIAPDTLPQGVAVPIRVMAAYSDGSATTLPPGQFQISANPQLSVSSSTGTVTSQSDTGSTSVTVTSGGVSGTSKMIPLSPSPSSLPLPPSGRAPVELGLQTSSYKYSVGGCVAPSPSPTPSPTPTPKPVYLCPPEEELPKTWTLTISEASKGLRKECPILSGPMGELPSVPYITQGANCVIKKDIWPWLCPSLNTQICGMNPSLFIKTLPGQAFLRKTDFTSVNGDYVVKHPSSGGQSSTDLFMPVLLQGGANCGIASYRPQYPDTTTYLTLQSRCQFDGFYIQVRAGHSYSGSHETYNMWEKKIEFTKPIGPGSSYQLDHLTYEAGKGWGITNLLGDNKIDEGNCSFLNEPIRFPRLVVRPNYP